MFIDVRRTVAWHLIVQLLPIKWSLSANINLQKISCKSTTVEIYDFTSVAS